MPDFAPTFTPRYVLHYRSGGLPHTWLFRGYRDETASATVERGQAAAVAIVTALSLVLPDNFTWTEAFYIPQDTEVSEIADTPDEITGDLDASGFSAEDKAKFIRFAGKAVGGSKVSITVFGVQLVTDAIPSVGVAKFLVTSVESAPVAATVAALQDANLAAINNRSVRWYERATVKTNDHWIKEIRKSS